MTRVQGLSDWLVARGMSGEELARSSGLDERVITAMLAERYTPSPQQRAKVAAVLGVDVVAISWGQVGVDPMYGHGPQFGRSP